MLDGVNLFSESFKGVLTSSACWEFGNWRSYHLCCQNNSVGPADRHESNIKDSCSPKSVIAVKPTSNKQRHHDIAKLTLHHMHLSFQVTQPPKRTPGDRLRSGHEHQESNLTASNRRRKQEHPHMPLLCRYPCEQRKNSKEKQQEKQT